MCRVANNEDVLRLVSKKNMLNKEKKLKKIYKIVVNKFSCGRNDSDSINVFDALVIKENSKYKEDFSKTNYLFDTIALFEVVYGIKIQYTEHCTISDFLNLTKYTLEGRNTNKQLYAYVKSDTGIQKRIIEGARSKVLNSKELDIYIMSYDSSWRWKITFIVNKNCYIVLTLEVILKRRASQKVGIVNGIQIIDR